MCAKLTVWNLTWEGLLERGARALGDISVFGVKTTIPYYQEMLKNADFRRGQFNTSFVDDHPELTDYQVKQSPELLAAAIGAAFAAHEGL
jgi:pyruvate carboxylase subunit A